MHIPKELYRFCQFNAEKADLQMARASPMIRLMTNEETLTAWPDNFDLQDDTEDSARIRTFIEAQLKALKDLDEQRKIWVAENLPADYEITYLFYDHTLRVAEDVKRTVLHMGLPARVAENMHAAMLVHDCGKTQLPLHLWDMVKKPEDSIKSERRRHTELGAQLVKEQLGDIDHPFIPFMLDIILNHHEQMDGKGHLGLTAEQLSLPVRLACIVESFDGYSIPRPHFGDRDVSVAGVLARMRDEKGAALYDMNLFESFAQMKNAGYKETVTI